MPSIFSTDYVRPACQKPDQRGTISGSRTLNVRFCLDSDRRADVAAGPKGATSGSPVQARSAAR
jgi:hypothetical protein